MVTLKFYSTRVKYGGILIKSRPFKAGQMHLVLSLALVRQCYLRKLDGLCLITTVRTSCKSTHAATAAWVEIPYH